MEWTVTLIVQTSLLLSATPSDTSHSIYYVIKFALGSVHSAESSQKKAWKVGQTEERVGRGDGVKHESRSEHGRWRWEEGITRNCINERGSCCTGLSPCSSTQNMPLCSAHVSLLHARKGGGGLGKERGFSWGTEGCWEGRSWLPECSVLSSTQAWACNTHTYICMSVIIINNSLNWCNTNL